MTALNFLVVDDASFIRDLVKKAVKEVYPNCNLHEATDGRKAVSQMKQKNIHVVLCDWEMPEMSGLEVLQWMRAEERYQNTPFMMITSRGERDHVVKAAQAGVSDYIGKPFTRENFAGKLTKMVWKYLKVKPNQAGEAKDPLASGSADLLAAKPASKPKPAVSNDMGGASVLMGSTVDAKADTAEAPAKKKSKKATKAKALANVRFGSGSSAKLVIKDISLLELIGVFKRDGQPPALLEQVVLDIVDQDAGDVVRINGYVRTLQAQEPHPDAETIQIVIRYVDDDPEKLGTLSRFIAKVR